MEGQREARPQVGVGSPGGRRQPSGAAVNASAPAGRGHHRQREDRPGLAKGQFKAGRGRATRMGRPRGPARGLPFSQPYSGIRSDISPEAKAHGAFRGPRRNTGQSGTAETATIHRLRKEAVKARLPPESAKRPRTNGHGQGIENIITVNRQRFDGPSSSIEGDGLAYNRENVTRQRREAGSARPSPARAPVRPPTSPRSTPTSPPSGQRQSEQPGSRLPAPATATTRPQVQIASKAKSASRKLPGPADQRHRRGQRVRGPDPAVRLRSESDHRRERLRRQLRHHWKEQAKDLADKGSQANYMAARAYTTATRRCSAPPGSVHQQGCRASGAEVRPTRAPRSSATTTSRPTRPRAPAPTPPRSSRVRRQRLRAQAWPPRHGRGPDRDSGPRASRRSRPPGEAPVVPEGRPVGGLQTSGEAVTGTRTSPATNRAQRGAAGDLAGFRRPATTTKFDGDGGRARPPQTASSGTKGSPRDGAGAPPAYPKGGPHRNTLTIAGSVRPSLNLPENRTGPPSSKRTPLSAGTLAGRAIRWGSQPYAFEKGRPDHHRSGGGGRPTPASSNATAGLPGRTPALKRCPKGQRDLQEGCQPDGQQPVHGDVQPNGGRPKPGRGACRGRGTKPKPGEPGISKGDGRPAVPTDPAKEPTAEPTPSSRRRSWAGPGGRHPPTKDGKPAMTTGRSRLPGITRATGSRRPGPYPRRGEGRSVTQPTPKEKHPAKSGTTKATASKMVNPESSGDRHGQNWKDNGGGKSAPAPSGPAADQGQGTRARSGRFGFPSSKARAAAGVLTVA